MDEIQQVREEWSGLMLACLVVAPSQFGNAKATMLIKKDDGQQTSINAQKQADQKERKVVMILIRYQGLRQHKENQKRQG